MQAIGNKTVQVKQTKTLRVDTSPPIESSVRFSSSRRDPGTSRRDPGIEGVCSIGDPSCSYTQPMEKEQSVQRFSPESVTPQMPAKPHSFWCGDVLAENELLNFRNPKK